MSDRIRDIQSRLMKNLQGGDQLAAAVAYVPLVGWIYPYFFKREDELCQFHGRQALKLNGALVAIYIAVWFLENFPLSAWLFGTGEPLNALSRTVWLVTLLGFLAVSVVAALKAFAEELWEIPYLDDAVDLVREQIQNERERTRAEKTGRSARSGRDRGSRRSEREDAAGDADSGEDESA